MEDELERDDALLEETLDEEPPKKKKRAKRKAKNACTLPYVSSPGRCFDLVDGVKMVDGGTVKVEMKWSLGFAGVALNSGDLAVLPANVAAIYIRKNLAKEIS